MTPQDKAQQCAEIMGWFEWDGKYMKYLTPPTSEYVIDVGDFDPVNTDHSDLFSEWLAGQDSHELDHLLYRSTPAEFTDAFLQAFGGNDV